MTNIARVKSSSIGLSFTYFLTVAIFTKACSFVGPYLAGGDFPVLLVPLGPAL